MGSKTRFEKEAKGNSQLAYSQSQRCQDVFHESGSEYRNFCCYCWFVFFFFCVCVFFHSSLSFVIWLLVHVDSLSSPQALAVYGQVTGKPKDDPPPPPAGLPDPTTKDPEPSDDQTRKGSDGETEKGKPSASLASDFREVEGSSKDIHMRWKPPVSSRSHFTAAASPTRARDFWVYIATLQLSNYFLRVLKSERHVACTPAKFKLV